MGFTDLGVQCVFGHTLAVNAASRRVLEKSGLRLVRTSPFKGPDVIEGAEQGEVEYALTRPEWEAEMRPRRAGTSALVEFVPERLSAPNRPPGRA
jgi:hypothetical protein